MPYNTYPYEIAPLPYPYNALEPYITAETMHYHHDKHYQAYVNNLYATLAPYPKLQALTLEQLLTRPGSLPRDVYTAIMHNGGGVYNHRLFFQNLAPAGSQVHTPAGGLAHLINQTFESFDNFKKIFSQQALNVFGSGWACLALTPQKKLRIISLANQETVLKDGARPVMLCDVWEHAYYLQYKNLRADYVQNIWNVITFLPH